MRETKQWKERIGERKIEMNVDSVPSKQKLLLLFRQTEERLTFTQDLSFQSFFLFSIHIYIFKIETDFYYEQGQEERGLDKKDDVVNDADDGDTDEYGNEEEEED